MWKKRVGSLLHSLQYLLSVPWVLHSALLLSGATFPASAKQQSSSTSLRIRLHGLLSPHLHAVLFFVSCFISTSPCNYYAHFVSCMPYCIFENKI